MLLGDALAHWARVTPSAVAAIHPESDGRMTYADLDALASRTAHALLGAGATRGDRVAVLVENEPAVLALYYGAARAGVTVVPISTRLVAAEVAQVLAEAEPVGVVASSNQQASLGDPRRFEWAWSLGEPEPGFVDLGSVISGQPAQAPAEPSERDDLFEMYTSGTTGRAKGVITSHGAWVASMWAQAFARQVDRTLVLLHTLPLGHVGGTNWLLLPTFVGGTVVVRRAFRPESIVETIEAERVTEVVLVPTMLRMLLDSPAREGRDLSSLCRIYYGGAFMDEELAARARRELDVRFFQTYGLTEVAGGLVTILSVDDHLAGDETARDRARRSVGQEILGLEVSIVDEEGRRLPAGQVGEIAIRGDAIMSGYASGPGDAGALRDGWLVTGDVGRLDADGYLFISDRKADVIITGGLNVYSQEVEGVLHEVHGVDQAYVFGMPDPLWGERVSACVVVREGLAVSASDLLRACQEALAGFKIPRSLYFVDQQDLPRSLLGKVTKRRLPDLVTGRVDALVDPAGQETEPRQGS